MLEQDHGSGASRLMSIDRDRDKGAHGVNPSGNEPFGQILMRRASRRTVLRGAAAITSATVLVPFGQRPLAASRDLSFEELPKGIDETARIDGYSLPRFFVKIFLPLIKAGVGVTAFFCFMFSWVELLLARTLTSVNAKPIAATMTRTVSASGMDWGTLAAAGVLTLIPGALVIYFVRHYIAKGFAMGRV